MVLLGTVSADNIEKTDAEAKKAIHFENSLVYGSQFAAEDLPHVSAALTRTPVGGLTDYFASPVSWR